MAHENEGRTKARFEFWSPIRIWALRTMPGSRREAGLGVGGDKQRKVRA